MVEISAAGYKSAILPLKLPSRRDEYWDRTSDFQICSLLPWTTWLTRRSMDGATRTPDLFNPNEVIYQLIYIHIKPPS